MPDAPHPEAQPDPAAHGDQAPLKDALPWTKHSELGHAAQRAGDLSTALEHHAAAARLLAEAGAPARLHLGLEFLQLARIEAMEADEKGAAVLFRSALACATQAGEPRLWSLVWHYVAAWCERRELYLAAVLAYQEARDALPEDETDQRLRELHHQLLSFDRLQAWPALLGTIQLLEAAGVTNSRDLHLPSVPQVLDRLGLPAEARLELQRILQIPGRPAMLHDDLLGRARAAIPNFARRFAAGELELEDTAAAVLTTDAPPPQAPKALEPALAALGDAVDRAAAWDPGAEDALRSALGGLEETGDEIALAYGWDRIGAYLLDRAQSAAALLAYAAEIRLAEAASQEDGRRSMLIDEALRGATYALADLHDTHAQLACVALLERRGALGVLSPVDALLAGQNLSVNELRRLHEHLLDDDARCREALNAAVDRARQRYPDFERRFRSGAERFDSPARLLDILRVPVSNPRQRDTAVDGVQRLYKRRWLGRSAVAIVMPLAAVLLMLYLDAASWARPLQLVALASIGGLAVLLARRARDVRRWINASAATEADLRVLDDIERAASTHAEAYAILTRCLCENTPFALYLRSFEREGAERVATKPESEEADRMRRTQLALLEGQSPSAVTAGFVAQREVVLSSLGSPSAIDDYLANRLAVHLPVVAVLNPVAPRTRGRVPRLELGHDAWELAVRLLVSAARIIVMECTVLAPGVLRELDVLVNRRRATRTVVVLPSAKMIDDVQCVREIAGVIASGVQHAPFATRGAAPLAPFDRVIEADALLAADPGELSVFDGLLPSGERKQGDEASSLGDDHPRVR